MSNLHVIIGEDDFLVEEAAKKLIGDGGGLETVDSGDQLQVHHGNFSRRLYGLYPLC